MKKNKTVLFLSFQSDRIDIHNIETKISLDKIKKALTGLKFPINIDDIDQTEFKFFKYKKDEFIGYSIYAITIYHKDKLKSLVKKINKLSENTYISFPLCFNIRNDGLYSDRIRGKSAIGKLNPNRIISFLKIMEEKKASLDLGITNNDITAHSFFYGRTGVGKSLVLQSILKNRENMIIDIGFNTCDTFVVTQKLSDLFPEAGDKEKEWKEKILPSNWIHI